MSARAAIYTRISEDPASRQTGRSVNCETQEADCRAVADQRGSQVARVFTDGDLTAADPKVTRPGFEALLEGVLAGDFDEVIVYTQDRFVRLPADIERVISAFTVAGVTLVPVTGVTDFSTPEGKLYARFNTLLGSFEVEKVRVRVRRKMLALAESGLKPAGQPGYGYDTVLLPDGRKTLGVVEDEAAIVQEMARRVLAGETLHAIATDLNARDVPTSSTAREIRNAGNTWRSSNVKRILLSPRVAGLRVHNGEVVGKAEWPAIIDQETAAHLRRVLTDPRRKVSAKPRTTRMLTGIAECGKCGQPLNHGNTGKAGTQARKYYCRHCHGTLIAGDRLEEYVRDLLVEAVDSEALRSAYEASAGLDGTADLIAELNRLDGELAALADDYGRGDLSRDEWQVARAGLMRRRQRTADDLERAAATRTSSPWLGRGVELASVWDDLQATEQRATIQAVFDRIVVKPANRGFNRFDRDRVDVRWRV